eukprot:g15375.t2
MCQGIAACADGKQGLEVLKLFDELRCEALQPTAVTYCSLAAGLSDFWLHALELLEDAAKRKVQASWPLRNSVLNALSWEAGLIGLQGFLQEGSAPNTITFNTLLNAAEWQQASELMNAMKRRGVQRSFVSFLALAQEPW